MKPRGDRFRYRNNWRLRKNEQWERQLVELVEIRRWSFWKGNVQNSEHFPRLAYMEFVRGRAGHIV